MSSLRARRGRFERGVGRGRLLALCVTLSAVLSACPEESSDTLVVELRTDLAPGIEFERFEIVGSATLLREVQGQEVGADWSRPQAMGELAIAAGAQRMRARLVQRDAIVVERELLVQVEGRTGLQIVLSRECAEVECGLGEACLAGQCVTEGCLTGAEPTCELVPECLDDSDCVVGAPCAPQACEPGGWCFARSLECPAGEWCDPSAGCTTIPSAEDAGVTDAGRVDAGQADAGPDDAGVDAGALPDASAPRDASTPDGGPNGSVEWVVGIDAELSTRVHITDALAGPCAFFDTRGPYAIEAVAGARIAGDEGAGVVVACFDDADPTPPILWSRFQSASVDPLSHHRFDCHEETCAWGVLNGTTLDVGIAHSMGGTMVTSLGISRLYDIAMGWLGDTRSIALAARDDMGVDGVFHRWIDPAGPLADFELGADANLVTEFVGDDHLVAGSFQAPFTISTPTLRPVAFDPALDRGVVFSSRTGPPAAVYETSGLLRILDITTAPGLVASYYVLATASADLTVDAPAGSPIPSANAPEDHVVVFGLDDQLRLMHATEAPPATSPILDGVIHAGPDGVIVVVRSETGGDELGAFIRFPADLATAAYVAQVRSPSVSSCVPRSTSRGYCAGARLGEVRNFGRPITLPATDAYMLALSF